MEYLFVVREKFAFIVVLLRLTQISLWLLDLFSYLIFSWRNQFPDSL